MNIPGFFCTGCKDWNHNRDVNLKVDQETFTIRRVVVRCQHCDKDRILGV